MKRRKFLHTNFVKFLNERYKEELQDIQDEAQEEIENDEDLMDEVPQVQSQAQDEQEDETQNEDDDDFDKMVKEYKELEIKYNKRKNDRIYNKRK